MKSSGVAPEMEKEPLTERIRTYRNEYNKQRAVMRKIEDERTGEWDMTVAQLQSMVTQLEEEITEVKLDFCFDNL